MTILWTSSLYGLCCWYFASLLGVPDEAPYIGILCGLGLIFWSILNGMPKAEGDE